MTTQETIKKTGDFIKNSATIKIFSIGLLIMILLIPTSMITSMMRERESRRDSVVQEINQKWGNSQIVTGPFFTIPYKSFYKDEKDKIKFNMHYLHILPENLNISGKLYPQIRYRSIYEAVLYNAQIQVNGNFTIPVLSQSNIDVENVLWEKAIFSIGITDMRGIQDNIKIVFNQDNYKANPGLKTTDIVSSGVHCYIPLLETKDTNSFSFQLNLNGSEVIQFVPLGETTSLKLKSNWPSPSFNGAYLPTNREVSDKGFSADWNVLHLNRNFPQLWIGNQYKVSDTSFGLKLLITADIYQKSIRISKYAIMFIVFTFSAFFLSEIINKKRVHPIQYILIGLAVILFYVLLLSISEHLNFDIAYILSAFAITTTITAYSKGIIKNNHFTLTVCGVLIILYSYLYIVLQLEDFALIMGSIGLFVVLTTIMYITRKIDWYSLDKDQI
ncbi:cell envelope integrity protein CreD [Desulfobacula toluolica]|uniref:CreD: inner membrane protein n=1 Tax=Desulfobacula toluolica (strain DSM 7467 / Tol2) TaxID=651182 RepID=K0NES6_DESTT|nr:cell envelope integrity protein CreD [Desulfobacula toluolica]CCK79445.1 CreD: inner membrane protein [Desulfobacula toluolica Tol2]